MATSIAKVKYAFTGIGVAYSLLGLLFIMAIYTTPITAVIRKTKQNLWTISMAACFLVISLTHFLTDCKLSIGLSCFFWGALHALCIVKLYVLNDFAKCMKTGNSLRNIKRDIILSVLVIACGGLGAGIVEYSDLDNVTYSECNSLGSAASIYFLVLSILLIIVAVRAMMNNIPSVCNEPLALVMSGIGFTVCAAIQIGMSYTQNDNTRSNLHLAYITSTFLVEVLVLGLLIYVRGAYLELTLEQVVTEKLKVDFVQFKQVVLDPSGRISRMSIVKEDDVGIKQNELSSVV
uniref:Uncharacterized protein n=1 Tax=Mucochytrium quahogii TaxID=96639 RepID=A0A7S2RPV3_9STRA|mmetsp:Transcript_2890/g.5489  ORF Transcript_2890/g.5489 Transcript_2890/m.5489 type:complete len:291 (-) Transcript_2890:286-1158(-)